MALVTPWPRNTSCRRSFNDQDRNDWRGCAETLVKERFILAQPEIWWDMYHDRPTFSYVEWSQEDVKEYRGGLETKEGVHAVRPRTLSRRLSAD
jgi:hypothetical protein